MAVGYAFSFLSLLVLPLLPSQKVCSTLAPPNPLQPNLALALALTLTPPLAQDETHARKASRPHSPWFSLASVLLVVLALAYALTIDFLAISPATACLRIAGGEGCEEPEQSSPDLRGAHK